MNGRTHLESLRVGFDGMHQKAESDFSATERIRNTLPDLVAPVNELSPRLCDIVGGTANKEEPANALACPI